MKKIHFILIAVIGLMCVACDKHIEMPDLTLKTGHVLCTDGSLLPYSEYSKSKRRAIAVVFHINHNQDVQGDGYAVYLNDIYQASLPILWVLSKGHRVALQPMMVMRIPTLFSIQQRLHHL